jgi:hypothetical protein
LVMPIRDNFLSIWKSHSLFPLVLALTANMFSMHYKGIFLTPSYRR